ncbi:excinuclease ABC subunit UvrA [Pontibacter sp. G13]|uniref:excinuclease ABC subunit UvrA n=1 Tax=Pontibacter sp. G13 TaxID=3074898 RepID=UPI0028894461|nr:excinuclease ABC subunit UvrA [Pontibacter sp. G13]WNJ17719.1 excinuclease ABC subunit UvrA [Pontibacter sp. G13]
MDYIYIKNARVNNLKQVSIKIPRNRLVVITGVSGSGKSSLAFDTLYAEGQRRYVESLSSYARQFLDRMEKPEVDYIQGIAPAMAIQQKVSTSNPRSTVGTTTEIYDFLKLLFARAGKTYSPVSGKIVTSDSVSDVVDYILDSEEGAKIFILAKIPVRSKGYIAELELSLQKGFSRVFIDGQVRDIEEEIADPTYPDSETITLLIDRTILRKNDLHELRLRFSDSVGTAYKEGRGTCVIQVNALPIREFSEKFEADGMEFERPSVNLFSFNNPYGACPTCEGFGRILGIDRDLVIPDKSKSIFDGAVAPWRGEVMSSYKQKWITAAAEQGFPIHRPYYDLTPEEQDQLWDGVPGAMGLTEYFEFLASKTHKIQYRVMLARYRGYTTCPSCKGTRLRKDTQYVKVGPYNIGDLLFMQVNELLPALRQLDLSDTDAIIANRLMTEITNRLSYLDRVGLGYLSIHRKINTLSGGEMQRIRLATSLGSGLVGSMYILDEPSIGLHPRDTDRLTEILESLRDQGNTVIVVEHDESIMERADSLVDMGPGAGELGGEVVFSGTYDELIGSDTLTGNYLSGRKEIPLPALRRTSGNRLKLIGARMHNLKGVDVEIPLNTITVVTGVSGSGKSTLIEKILYPSLRKHLGEHGDKGGYLRELSGDVDLIKRVEMVDQRPVGRSARSNPATYIKAWDHIRELLSKQVVAQVKGLKPGDFSFNVDGGRCDNCQGEGYVTVEMQFLPDVKLLCDVCQGKRFKKHVLEVTYEGKNVDDILKLTIHEAMHFFKSIPKISSKLEILDRVGLGYLRMGQSTSTLSGGEAQRMKLAFFLSQGTQATNTCFIFDEPTTGLHFEDIQKLLGAMNELVEKGNTVIVIEHNLDVIKCADWIVDLGPEGGDQGGQLVFQGVPEDLVKVDGSYTAKYLKNKLLPQNGQSH